MRTWYIVGNENTGYAISSKSEGAIVEGETDNDGNFEYGPIYHKSNAILIVNAPKMFELLMEIRRDAFKITHDDGSAIRGQEQIERSRLIEKIDSITQDILKN